MSTATPPIRRRRTAATINAEPSEDLTKTKVIIPEGTKAMINEQIGGKNVTYEAELKEDETSNEREDTELNNEFEDFSEFEDFTPQTQIPKTPLDRLFDDVSYAIANDPNLFDSFYAKLLRQPDGIADRFSVPCRDIVELGVIQFSTQDRFSFISAIQDTNGNSGGRFAISIFNADFTPLTVYRGRALQAIPREVGITLVVPNPQPKPTTPNGNGGIDAGLSAILSKMVEINQSNHNQLMASLNRQPTKSTLEAAIEQKVLNDILNPPQHNNGGNNGTEIIANVMQSIAVTQAMGDAIARNLNREPPPAVEPDWIDKASKVAENPMVQQLIGRIGDIGEAIAVSKLNATATAPEVNNGVDQTNNMAQTEPDETQELILDIIEEIDSDNPLDATNETINELAADYPEQYADLVATCKSGASFDFIFDQLVKKTQTMQPSPFLPFLDLEQTNATQKFVWNEKGVRMKARLLELYHYLQTIS